MNQLPSQERLNKLLEKRAQVDAAIARMRSVDTAKKRKTETRRKILAGAVVLKLAREDEKLGAWLRKALEHELKTERDRAVFDLPPLPKAEAENQTP